MDEVVFLDDQNAPLRVCTGSDPRNSDIAVVKIRNNRGVGMVVEAPVTPTWAHVDLHTGELSALPTEILTYITEYPGLSDRSRSWILPPGAGVDIGFTEHSLAPMSGSSKITTTVSTSTLAFGLLWTFLDDFVEDPALVAALQIGIMGVCAVEGTSQAVTATDPGTLIGGLASIVVCAVERTPEILAEISARVPENVWNQLKDKGITKAAATAAGKVLTLLTIGKATVVAGDAISSLALPSSAYDIGLFTAVKRPPATAASLCGGTVNDTYRFEHPYLGDVQVSTVLNGAPGLSGGGCIVAISRDGSVLSKVDMAIYGEALDFADPAVDNTGNVFLTYNPGRYNGVVTLVPNENGFEPIEWNDHTGPNYGDTTHVYYFAELEGPGVDGEYAIRQFDNDCTPSCAGGTISQQLLRWNGHTYS